MSHRDTVGADVSRRLNEAWAALRAREPERARALADAVVAGAPEDARAVGGRAGLLWALGERDLACAEAERALRIDPEEGSAHVVLAEAARSRRRLKEAAAHLMTAYRVAPTVRRGTMLVRALREAGDMDEASRVWQELRARHPHDPAVVREGALLAEAQGREETAEALWGELMQDPEQGAFARGRQLALRARRADPANAADQLRRAADLRGRTDPAAGQQLRLEAAEADRAAGRLEQAAEGYRAYLAARPGDAYAMRQLAFVLRRLNRHAEARPLLEALLRRDPDDAFARSALVKDAPETDLEGVLAFLRGLVAEHPAARSLYGGIRRLEALRVERGPAEAKVQPPSARRAGQRQPRGAAAADKGDGKGQARAKANRKLPTGETAFPGGARGPRKILRRGVADADRPEGGNRS